MALATTIHTLLDSPEDIGVEAFDGTRVVPPDAQAMVVVRRPEAIGYLVHAPGELGLVRAFVSGDLDLKGNLYSVVDLGYRLSERSRVKALGLLRLLAEAGRPGLRSVVHAPPPPPEEAHLAGHRHSNKRDAAAISHHYDVSNAFYELMLGPSMTYSCAVFARPDETLEAAQAHKHELICTKLGLEPGMRLLDVGCGWGGMLIHAAQHHGVEGVGITISRNQAELARKRVADAGLSHRIDIRLQDYREIDDRPFDAISSIGMFEHVGRAGMLTYAQHLYDLVEAGGRLLNHAITRPVVAGGQEPPSRWRATMRRVEIAVGSSAPSRIESALMQRYVFPDGELHEVGGTVTLFQEVGFEVRHTENLREHYALTLRRWVDNLDAHWDEAVAEVGERRARVWKLYMSACALGFERHSTEVHQVLAVKPEHGYDAHFDLRPSFTI